MSLTLAAVLLPLAGAPLCAFAGAPLRAAVLTLGISGLSFLLTVLAPFGHRGALPADAVGMVFAILAGFVGFVAAGGQVALIRRDAASPDAGDWRANQALSLALLGFALLGFYARDIALLWVSAEAVAILACLGVGLAATPSALRAAWRYFLLIAPAIGLTLFGSLLVYLAAQDVPALGQGALGFDVLQQHAGQLNGGLMTLGFLFLLAGYGVQAAVPPLHFWLTGAYTAASPLFCALLDGLALNLPLVAILRFRTLMAANVAAGGNAMPPGPILLALGLFALLVGGRHLWRVRDARRLLGFAAIAQNGLVLFAFGLGGAAGIFAGVLHLLLRTLIGIAGFQGLSALLPAARLRRSGLPRGRRFAAGAQGLPLRCALFALTPLPPSPLFTSVFLIMGQTVRQLPLLCVPLAAGLLLLAGAVFRWLAPRGQAQERIAMRSDTNFLLAGGTLLLALVLGFAMPVSVLDKLSQVAEVLP
jgi:hydrogenase-4 component F